MFDRSIPMRGFHTTIDKHESVDAMIRLIDEGLAPLGYNTLVFEMRYAFRCFPEYATGTITFEDARRVADACAAQGMRLIPLLPCLSHQSVHSGPRGLPYPLFEAHPELLERQGVPRDADWPDFGLHSWCASNDAVYDYIFPMIDDMIDACRAETFHIGMDELFARTVKKLRDYLAAKGLDTMMWGDRLLDAQKMGYSMWEGDRFGIHPALHRADEVTRDILICDWHYEWHSAGYPSVETLMREGFFTVPAVWRDAQNAQHLWLHALEAHYLSNRCGWPGKLGGYLCTNWQALDAEQADNMLAAIAGKPAPACDAPGYGVGEVIARMAEKGKVLR
jgi:hypothetical protein